MPDIDLLQNLAGTKSWEEAAPILSGLFSRLQDQLQSNPSLLSLVDAKQEVPSSKVGDLVTDLRDGKPRIKIQAGKGLQAVEIDSFSGSITQTQHGEQPARWTEIDDEGNEVVRRAHPLATPEPGGRGFMSHIDKIKLDSFVGVINFNAEPELEDGQWAIWWDNALLQGWILVRVPDGVIKFGPATLPP